MNISQGIVLNLSAGGIPPRLRMVQGDSNTRTIEASLWGGAQPYAVPDGSSVMVRFRKPDGTGGLYDTTEGGSPITFDGNNVTAPVATQMLAVPGEVAAEIDIYGTGTGAAAEKLATFRFVVEVAPSVYPDAEIISSDYYNVLTAKIAEAVDAASAANASASAAAGSASAAAQSAASAAAAVEGAVKYNAAQSLTTAQQAQARENIGAASEAATTAALAGKQPTLTPGQNITISNNTIGTKAFPCNPNLLDNWYFGNPVNQRGQTSWNGSEGYTIDRWAAERYRTGTKSITLANGAINITNNDSSVDAYIGIVQLLEFDLPINSQVTLSALTASGLCVFQTSVTSGSVQSKMFDNFTAYFYQTGDENRRTVTLRVMQGKSETFYAVKLELGTEQTLAHQDANGNWVLNEIPDYGEQLRRCQRYYQTFPANLTVLYGNSGSSPGTGARLVLPCQKMRTNPVGSTFTVAVWGYASTERTFTIAEAYATSEGISLYGNISPAIEGTTGTYAPIIAQLRGSSLAFSADL